jgi:hypothetical protein
MADANVSLAESASFETCVESGGNWWPGLITFGVVFVVLFTLTRCFKNKVLYVTLLPARVIILGVLWSENPNHESIQLDMSFNEVSVSVMFILLVKNFIGTHYGRESLDLQWRPFLCFDKVRFTTILVMCSILALVPAISSIVAEINNQYAMGVLSTVVVVLLLSRQHKQTRPTEEVDLNFLNLIIFSTLIASLTLISSFADCLGAQGWVGLICAFPIDSLLILWKILTTDKEAMVQRIEHFRQVVYLIALSCYVHYTMTLIIWSTTKIDALKHIEEKSGVSAIVPLIVITAISGIIVAGVIGSVGFVKRKMRDMAMLKKSGDRLGGRTAMVSRPAAMTLGKLNDRHHIYERGSLRL